MGDDRVRFTRRRALAGAGLLAAGGTAAWALRPAPVRDSEGWEQVAPMPTARGEMKAAVLDGRVYVPGGLTGRGTATARTAAYDPGEDAWTSLAPMPAPLNHHAVAAFDGTLYAVGGNSAFDDPPGRHVFAYDPAADAWGQRAPLPDGRWGHELVANGDRLYLVGGQTTGGSEVLVYDGDGWTRGAPMPTPREHLAAGVVDGRILTVSGRHEGENDPAVEAYDPETDVWMRLEAEPEARSGTAGAVVDGRFHLAGGENPAPFTGWTTRTHEIFDGDGNGNGNENENENGNGDGDGNENGNAWSAAPALPLPLHGPAAVAHDGGFYVFGGAWRQGPWSVTAWSDRVFVYRS